jgi:hypothetical protein
VLTLLLIGGPVLALVWLLARRVPSQQHLWDHAVQVCAANPAFRLGQIIEVLSSDPEQGEHARISWHGNDVEQDIWFGDTWPLEDVWVVVSGADGDGTAGRDSSTFYVTAVHDVIVL